MGKTTKVGKVFEKQSKQQMVLQLCFLEFLLLCCCENFAEFTVDAISMLDVQMCNAFGVSLWSQTLSSFESCIIFRLFTTSKSCFISV